MNTDLPKRRGRKLQHMAGQGLTGRVFEAARLAAGKLSLDEICKSMGATLPSVNHLLNTARRNALPVPSMNVRYCVHCWEVLGANDEEVCEVCDKENAGVVLRISIMVRIVDVRLADVLSRICYAETEGS